MDHFFQACADKYHQNVKYQYENAETGNVICKRKVSRSTWKLNVIYNQNVKRQTLKE